MRFSIVESLSGLSGSISRLFRSPQFNFHTKSKESRILCFSFVFVFQIPPVGCLPPAWACLAQLPAACLSGLLGAADMSSIWLLNIHFGLHAQVSFVSKSACGHGRIYLILVHKPIRKCPGSPVGHRVGKMLPRHFWKFHFFEIF